MKNEINPDTLKRKLKRHKLSFTYEDHSNTLVLGGVANLTTSWVVSVILPLIFALLVFILTWFEMVPLFDKGRGVAQIIAFFIGIPVVFSLVGAARIILKGRRNADEKIISPQGVVIKNKLGNTVTLNGSQIKEFNYSIITDKSLSLGTLHLITQKDVSYVLLGFEDEEYKMLKDDMEYIKNYFKQLTTT